MASAITALVDPGLADPSLDIEVHAREPVPLEPRASFQRSFDSASFQSFKDAPIHPTTRCRLPAGI